MKLETTRDPVIEKSIGLGVVTDIKELALEMGAPPEVLEQLDEIGMALTKALLPDCSNTKK